MPNSWFQFKQFRIEQGKAAFKVGTDCVLLGAWCDCRRAKKVLDIGTGSGILSLMVAQRNPEVHITAVELDEDSAEQAAKNFAGSKFSERLKVIYADFNQYYKDCKERFDLIVCNPPYFFGSKPSANKNVAGARHQQKLDYERLLQGAAKLLNENGILSVIFPSEYDAAFELLAENQNFHCRRKVLISAHPGEKPIRAMGEWGFKMEEFKLEAMNLRAPENKNYSKEYRELTRDFYLKN